MPSKCHLSDLRVVLSGWVLLVECHATRVWSHTPRFDTFLYTAISRKVVGKYVHATIPKDNMGYDRYTVPDDCSFRTYFCCFPLALANTFSWPFVPILSIFSEEQGTQNHPQCLSGLSRAFFPTAFIEIAVYLACVAGVERGIHHLRVQKNILRIVSIWPAVLVYLGV